MDGPDEITIVSLGVVDLCHDDSFPPLTFLGLYGCQLTTATTRNGRKQIWSKPGREKGSIRIHEIYICDICEAKLEFRFPCIRYH